MLTQMRFLLQVADNADDDITGQTTQVLAQVDRLLALAGSDKTRILMTQVRIRLNRLRTASAAGHSLRPFPSGSRFWCTATAAPMLTEDPLPIWQIFLKDIKDFPSMNAVW